MDGSGVIEKKKRKANAPRSNSKERAGRTGAVEKRAVKEGAAKKRGAKKEKQTARKNRDHQKDRSSFSEVTFTSPFNFHL